MLNFFQKNIVKESIFARYFLAYSQKILNKLVIDLSWDIYLSWEVGHGGRIAHSLHLIESHNPRQSMAELYLWIDMVISTGGLGLFRTQIMASIDAVWVKRDWELLRISTFIFASRFSAVKVWSWIRCLKVVKLGVERWKSLCAPLRVAIASLGAAPLSGENDQK